MNIVFRADASVQIGTGHVMRCLTLAEQLRAQDHQCRFICRNHRGHLGKLIADRGFPVDLLSTPDNEASLHDQRLGTEHGDWLGVSWHIDAMQTLELLGSGDIDWIVVDHYGLDACWENQIGEAVGNVMVIDDLADRAHHAQLLLDQNLGRLESGYDGLLPAACKRLIGPKYALLRSEFAEFRAKSLRRRCEPELSRILISMGGTDTPNATGAVIQSLETSCLPSNLELDVVMGATAPWLSDIQQQAKDSRFSVTVSTNVQDMAERMFLADLSIGAAGSTSWERCALGLPSIVVCQALNQTAILTALSDAGAAIKLNFPFYDKELSRLLADLYEHPEELAGMAEKASRLCDGKGVNRVIGWLDGSE